MPKKDALNDQEIEELINACETDLERLIIITLIYTGMRVDELAHLKKYWMDFRNDVINIPSQDGDWKPKTEHGSRAIPIVEARLKYVLNQYFSGNEKIGLSRTTIWRIIKKIGSRTSIKHGIYPHSLRSTFASILAYKGISEGSMCSIMGWSSIKTAQDYVKLFGARAKEELIRKW